MAAMTTEADDAPTLHLLSINEVFVYKIPPMQSSTGHRAGDWNLEKVALTGSLRLISKGDKVYIQVFQQPESSAQLPKLFASCPIKLDSDTTKPKSKLDFFFQGVTDSSRYFVIRVEDEKSGRHAYIGIGFQERQSAFDLRAAIDDELKRIQRGDKHHDEDDESDLPVDTTPAVDRSLKEGQTIKVNIKVGGGGKKKKKKKAGGGGGLGLAPPPSSNNTRSLSQAMAATSISAPSQPVPSSTTTSESDDLNDLDFGDFQS